MTTIFPTRFARTLKKKVNLDIQQQTQQQTNQWGEITVVKVLRDQAGRPYAFVQYTNDEDARAALLNGQSTELDGRIIRCEPARVNRTLFIIASRTNPNATEQKVRKSLEEYGEIEEVISNDITPGMRPSWFVKFAYRNDAIQAYAAMSFQGEWNAEWAQNVRGPGDNMPVIDKFSIFVGQLNSTITEGRLMNRFQTYGKIKECKLVLRKAPPGTEDPRTNTFAFIKFESEVAAASAVEQENHTILDERTIHVQYREIQHGSRARRTYITPRLELAPPPVNFPLRMRYMDKFAMPEPMYHQQHMQHHRSPPSLPHHSYPSNQPRGRMSMGRDGLPPMYYDRNQLLNQRPWGNSQINPAGVPIYPVKTPNVRHLKTCSKKVLVRWLTRQNLPLLWRHPSHRSLMALPTCSATPALERPLWKRCRWPEVVGIGRSSKKMAGKP